MIGPILGRRKIWTLSIMPIRTKCLFQGLNI